MSHTDPESVLRSVAHHQKAIEECTRAGTSEIQKFYSKCTVFITGATGFLGKQLVEKLLRSTNVQKMYLLIRNKKGQSNIERLHHMIKDPVFDTIRKECPDFWTRLECVEGDVSEVRLGISNEHWNIITDEVDVIFHVAATTKFDEDLRVSAFINVRGTKEALLLGKACRKLRSFTHVSTAFTHATRSRAGTRLLETFYPAPVDPDLFLNMAESIDGGKFYGACAGLMEDWPNTYTFTKALAEELVRKEAGNLPVCVVRPPYVWSTYHEPAPGWVDNSCMFGPSGMMIGIGLGVVHVSLNRDVKLPFTPCDYVNNAILAAAWDVEERQKSGEKEIGIFTVANTDTAFQWNLIRNVIDSNDTRKLNTPQAVWYPFLIETGSSFVYWLLTWLLHYIPGYIVDGFYSVTGLKKPKRITSFVKLYSKIYRFGSTFEYFYKNEWFFDDSNLQTLFKKMDDSDKIIYNFDVRSIDWRHLILIWIVGLRKYIIKDDLKDNSGYKKQQYLKVLNGIVLSIYVTAIFLFIYVICNFVYGVCGYLIY